MEKTFDLFIIGGGINGAGIARDAAGRGLKVYLCDKQDFAQGTSSSSSKLIHGGLRYLETYEFSLVKESLREREVLMKIADHLVSPMTFILPHTSQLRPFFLIRAGLYLYDFLAGRKKTLHSSKTVHLKKSPYGVPLESNFKKAVSYSDCWVDDARLVIENLISARNLGAEVKNYTECVEAKKQKDFWQLKVKDIFTQKTETIRAKALVNASGPWAQLTNNNVILDSKKEDNLRYVKGSHIITPKLYEGSQSYILQSQDNRVVFVIPYENDFTLIGTTDVEVNSPDEGFSISEDEKHYLCDVVNEYFKSKITVDDIVYHYSGVRPLFQDGTNDPSKVTRDYKIILVGQKNEAPLINIYGGKLTTYRKLSEKVLSKLENYFPSTSKTWTSQKSLQHNQRNLKIEDFKQAIYQKYSFINQEYITSIIERHGFRAEDLFHDIQQESDLGIHFGHGLYEKEVNYLLNNEWACNSDDILKRRTKFEFKLNTKQKQRLNDFLEKKAA